MLIVRPAAKAGSANGSIGLEWGSATAALDGKAKQGPQRDPISVENPLPAGRCVNLTQVRRAVLGKAYSRRYRRGPMILGNLFLALAGNYSTDFLFLGCRYLGLTCLLG